MKYLAVAFPYNDFAFVYFDNWIPRRSSAATAKMSKKQKSSKSKGGDSDFYPMIVPERAAARQAAMKLKEPGGRPGGQPGSAPAPPPPPRPLRSLAECRMSRRANGERR